MKTYEILTLKKSATFFVFGCEYGSQLTALCHSSLYESNFSSVLHKNIVILAYIPLKYFFFFLYRIIHNVTFCVLQGSVLGPFIYAKHKKGWFSGSKFHMFW